MSKVFDKPIIIQKKDAITEKWSNLYNLHAAINKAKNDEEYLSGGAEQSKRSLVFEVRYFKALADIELNTQLYQIIYNGNTYNITDYDDFQMKHKTIKLLGESY